MSVTIRIGTRGSQLALWQANEVSRQLTERGYRPEIVPFKTTADKRQDVPLASIGKPTTPSWPTIATSTVWPSCVAARSACNRYRDG